MSTTHADATTGIEPADGNAADKAASKIICNASVYVETSSISYLAARPRRDVIVLAHQEVTRTWWEQRSRYRLFLPRLVEEEIASGDTTAAAPETTREFDPLLGNPFRKLAGTKPKRQPQIEVSPVAR